MDCQFIALFAGETPEEARVVALSADPQTVEEFASRALYQPLDEDRRGGLRLVKDEKRPSPDSPAKSYPSSKGVHR